MASEILDSVLRDHGILDEVTTMQRLPPSALHLEREGFAVESVRHAAERLIQGDPSALASAESLVVESGAAMSPEAIVLLVGRPVMFIQDDRLVLNGSLEWRARLQPFLGPLERALPSIGRVEIANSTRFPFAGTGWMIDDDTLVTNRHVARLFCSSLNQPFVIGQNVFGDRFQLRVDFAEEHDREGVEEIDVAEVLWVADDRELDIAFLKLSRSDILPAPLQPARAVPDADDGFIAVVGYPARDGTRNPGDGMSRIFADVYNKKRLAPGRVIRQRGECFSHDCTTLGGNSGSAVLDVETGNAIGLHFAGRFQDRNLAVDINAVLKRLGEVGRRVVAQPGDGVNLPSFISKIVRGAEPGTLGALVTLREDAAEDAERRGASPADYADRQGFDRSFLPAIEAVEPPVLNITQQQQSAPVHSGGIELKYTHFSVWMNAERRLAWFTAVNIDGARLRDLKRSDDWRTDPRIDLEHQADNALYKHNPLDRGHLVRRLDPVWGDDEEARRAESDTFHYTVAAPQHAELNQQTWLSLEDHLLDKAGAHDLRLCVFTGPIFQLDDRRYRGVRLPREFWKIVVMTLDLGDGPKAHATGYLLSQANMLRDVEFAFGAFRTYQVPLATIEARSGLGLAHLRAFDPLEPGEQESMRGLARPLTSWRDIKLARTRKSP
ncbi:MAG: DNA/RNA non-specific endonuclease [Geminicoccaceae bacterium]